MRAWPVIAVLWSLASPAFADLAPRDAMACRDQAKGTACETEAGEAGTCETATCSKHDYSQGVPPRTVSYECLKCRKAEAPAPVPAPAPAPTTPSAPVPTPAPVAASTPPASKGLGCVSSEFTPAALLALATLSLRRRRPSNGASRSSR